MGYRPRPTMSRSSRRRSEKAKPKSGIQKTKIAHGPGYEQQEAPTSVRVLDKALGALRSLGNQRFGLPPFSEHFERWFLTLQTLLSDFRSNPVVSVDDQFLEECNKVLSDTEAVLKEGRIREASHREMMLSQLEAKNLLLQAEREYTAKAKQLANQEEEAVGPLSSKVKSLKEQLESIAQMKAGFFRGISKEEKAHREAEAKQKLDAAERELKEIAQSFQVKRETFKNEYERRRHQLLAQIEGQQGEPENLGSNMEVDTTVETRREVCNALIAAVHTLAERNASVQSPRQ